jgi:hypothetical protein
MENIKHYYSVYFYKIKDLSSVFVELGDPYRLISVDEVNIDEPSPHSIIVASIQDVGDFYLTTAWPMRKPRKQDSSGEVNKQNNRFSLSEYKELWEKNSTPVFPQYAKCDKQGHPYFYTDPGSTVKCEFSPYINQIFSLTERSNDCCFISRSRIAGISFEVDRTHHLP